MVFSMTFTSPTSDNIWVESRSCRGDHVTGGSGRFNLKTASARPRLAPNLAQVSRSTRELYLSSYYSPTYIVGNPDFCLSWIYSLRSSHRRFLRKVLCLKYKAPSYDDHSRISNIAEVLGATALSLEFVDDVSPANEPSLMHSANP